MQPWRCVDAWPVRKTGGSIIWHYHPIDLNYRANLAGHFFFLFCNRYEDPEHGRWNYGIAENSTRSLRFLEDNIHETTRRRRRGLPAAMQQ